MPELRDRRHEAGMERILDDLRSDLYDLLGEGNPWADCVEDAMNSAWDRLLKLGAPDA